MFSTNLRTSLSHELAINWHQHNQHMLTNVMLFVWGLPVSAHPALNGYVSFEVSIRMMWLLAECQAALRSAELCVHPWEDTSGASSGWWQSLPAYAEATQELGKSSTSAAYNWWSIGRRRPGNDWTLWEIMS